jgi:hypothetical protein
VTPSSLVCASVSVAVLLGARATNAACVISVVRPTVPLPTMAAGQQFSFVATPDCEKLRFRVPGTTFVKVPRAADAGPRDRTYKVVLTESEWDSLVDERDTTFTWSITGTTSAGVQRRVTTTNELKADGGVTIDMSMADAKLVGEEAEDYAGYSVSGAGDVDGNGHDDLLVGALGDDEGAFEAGAAYLVLGPVTGTRNLSFADAKLVGEERRDWAGCSVSGAGDVDRDGHDDLLVGAFQNDEGGSDAGAAYLLLGPLTGTLDLSLADAKLVGESRGEYAGGHVSAAGDVVGDGHDDLLVGTEFNSLAGRVYLVRGPVAGTLDLSLADAALVAEERYDFLTRGSDAGDVDGDGHDDLLLGALGNDEGAGAAYLVLGPVTGTLDLSLADAKLTGERPGDWAGASISGAGDVDGDGHDDLLIGAPYNDEEGSAAGSAYLVLGPVTGTRDLSLADAKLLGEMPTYIVPHNAVSGAGDVDDDGHDDLLVSTCQDLTGDDRVYLVLGPVTGTLDLALADAKLEGEEGSDGACGVADAGDVDADGRADILVGAYLNDEGGSYAGAAYLLYGREL